jgi:hypothetical protein
MSWVYDLEIGDCWYNKDRDHIAILRNKTKTHLFYVWVGLEQKSPYEDYGLLRVKFEDAEKHARSWVKLSSLEKELV